MKHFYILIIQKVIDDFPPEIVVQLGMGFGTFVKRNGFNEHHISLYHNNKSRNPQFTISVYSDMSEEKLEKADFNGIFNFSLE